ncbi:MAG: hypothetical protein JW873_06025 [Candidatus Saganbacteria bacterium]|nr:hypothetical protein [Candidatus Saganbacteria bacterium]
MSDLLDGLSNVEALTAQINALQKGQDSKALNASGASAADPDTFILQTQQNFNSMLTALMATPDSSGSSGNSTDAFSSFLSGSDQSSLQAQLQLATSSYAGNLQKLTALERNSQLIGKRIIYQDQSGAQQEAVISQIAIDQKGNASVVSTDGRKIAVSAILGLKQ